MNSNFSSHIFQSYKLNAQSHCNILLSIHENAGCMKRNLINQINKFIHIHFSRREHVLELSIVTNCYLSGCSLNLF